MARFTRSQLDRLGQTLRAGSATDDDLRALAAYRDEVAVAGRAVLTTLRKLTAEKYSVSERARKTTNSIVAKLQRQPLTLGQMQDISGCRLIVPDLIVSQDVAAKVVAEFPKSRLVDRRKNPSHGYRAVHIIVYNSDYPYEIQLRTNLENAWAQLSEKAADVYGFQLKYGGGPDVVAHLLNALSDILANTDLAAAGLARLEQTDPDNPQTRQIRRAVAEDRAETERILAGAKELF